MGEEKREQPVAAVQPEVTQEEAKERIRQAIMDLELKENAITKRLLEFFASEVKCNSYEKLKKKFKVLLHDNSHDSAIDSLNASNLNLIYSYVIKKREQLITHNAANFFMQDSNAPKSPLRVFSDRLVVTPPPPEEKHGEGLPGSTATTLSGEDSAACSYKGVRLAKENTIQSVAKFESIERANKKTEGATAVLTQNHEGTVSDHTMPDEKNKLTDDEKVLVALKQAKMYLTNLKETSKEQTIIISGDDVKQARRVYAALLLLKGNMKVKIDSYVIGFDVPKKGNLDFFGFEQKQINEYLPPYLIPKDFLDTEKKNVSAFIQNTKGHREQVAALKNQKTKLKVPVDEIILKDDTLDGRGNRLKK